MADGTPDQNWRILRQQIADIRPSWTMDYIDSLPWYEIDDLLEYQEGKMKAQEK